MFQRKINKKAFTLIELLVVIAIIGILSTLAIVSLQNARKSARDAKRVADVKQLQNAIELYYSDENSYPSSLDNLVPNYMTILPQAPSPADGDCTSENNEYTYSTDGSTYSISFCTGSPTGDLPAGEKIAGPLGFLASASSSSPSSPSSVDPNQDYDAIHTLTFDESSVGTTSPITLFRGSEEPFSGTVYYRAGTSGEWTALSVSGFAETTFPITATTMQIAHNWNKNGNDYMTPSFFAGGYVTAISISTKEVLSGAIGNNFMYLYAAGCPSLTSLTSASFPDMSNVTSIGDNFMEYYVYENSSIKYLSAPNISNVTSVGDGFMYSYVWRVPSLISLDVPDTSSIISAGHNFMGGYASGASSLTSLSAPDTSSMSSVGSYFLSYYASGCSSLTSLILPKAGYLKNNNIDWGVPSDRLGILKGHVIDSADLNDWKSLVVDGKTLHTNYIRNAADVIMKP